MSEISKPHIDGVENVNQLDEFTDAFRRDEARLVRKLDLYIAPVLMLLMLISYLDRGNIGYAATQGMNEDIGLKGSEFNVAVSVFYIFYVLAEFPVSLFARRLQFNRIIPAATVGWGLVCLCNGLVHDFGGLVACRLVLGLTEGFLFPSMTLMLATWFRREELATRISYLFIASALAGAFGGLIAFGILYMDGVADYPGWRWLYIIEGAFTIVVGACCVFLIPKNFEQAYFLNEDDKRIMRRRAEDMEAYSGGKGHYTMSDVKAAVQDMKTWIHGSMQICAVTILYGFGTFLPVILKNGFNFSTEQAQYLVIPVNLWGAVIYWLGAVLSDRFNARSLVMAVAAPFGIAGYAILLAWDVPAGVQYFATFLIATSCFLCAGTNIAWMSGNCAPDGKKAASLGIQLTLTNIGGVVAGQIYQSESAPRYVLGNAWSLASVAVVWIGCVVLRYIYLLREREKQSMRAVGDGGIDVPESWRSTDRDVDFKYML
ncbi:uncharacterized protein APUU_41426S [Aspergillus puulaauensis]|uniref:Major facilitator superfamily (MFS) profile domain-containing protein n=1 Tax=Aspergillus puulaauensis TaxID=1220207 RepID=A0A7R7XNU5_9EURO|nr:uncharacterized protein APUU_41426S [Aspergillus puulaauensis]BCS24982.1 hypothetical protein APUU_41426S [Aspergillus puulaauensis]